MKLARDQRGAIMVLALFMAIFATGCLYYVVGVGSAVAHRERMQDAADAAAFSAAVLHARGMNVIALINMTMAALLAVLISLQLVQLVCTAGVALAVSISFFTGGASLAVTPTLTQIGITATQAYEQAKPVIHGSLRALRWAAKGVRIAIPWIAQTRTIDSVQRSYGPHATVGFEVPGSLTLPTRDGTYGDLCRKAGEYIGDVFAAPLPDTSPFGFSLGDITGSLVGETSAYFCETAGGSPPAISQKLTVWHPILPKAQACKDYALSERPDRATHEALCAQGEQDTARTKATIDARSGACLSDCGPNGLYEQGAGLALAGCAPRPNREHYFGMFTWQARHFTRRYVRKDGAWAVEADTVPGSERFTLERDTYRPCGTSGATIGPEWNMKGGAAPVCGNVAPPDVATIDGEVINLRHTEVLRILGCRELVSERREVQGEQGVLAGGEDADQMAPQLIAKDAQLGEEMFQIRAFVFGALPSASPAPLLGGLESAAGDENAGALLQWDAQKQLGRIAVAQAELYFDEAGARPADYLWAMRWSARLRRFRWSDAQPSARTADDLLDAAANAVGAVFSTFDEACDALLPEELPCDELDPTSFADDVMH